MAGRAPKTKKPSDAASTRRKSQANDREQVISAISRSMGIIEFALDGTILEANDNFLAAMGYRADEVAGKNHRMFVEPAYAESSEYREFWNSLRRGEAQIAEFRRIGKGGRDVYIRASYMPILDAQGRPYKVVKAATDVSAERLAAQRASEERERLLAESLRVRSAVDGSTVPIMMANEALEVVYLNESMRQLLSRYEADIQAQLPRFSVDSMVGTSFDVFQKRPANMRRLLEGLTGNHRERLEIGGRLIDQVVVPARDPKGKTIGYSVEWLDQTDQVRAQTEVERVLKAAVDGDMTPRLEADHYEGFVQKIGEGMNHLLDSVSESFRQVKTAVEQIGQASTELRSTSQMMSSGAVELNRAAEDSSTSLQKAAEMVRTNAENAAMANQLVTQTATAARNGQARMEDMSSSMGEINASAQQIARIIKVIDEIAFQTNLLALNAAVEAARAGRYGKGFAVVAQEVRNLAERSAKAAKETAQLIEDSVAKVEQGVRIARETRGALGEIIENVAKVVDLAGEIATASEEQSHTLETVTSSMAQVTESAQAGSQQSNQVASAAEEMGRQMEVLAGRMEGYKLAEENKPGPLPAGVTPEMFQHIAMMLMKSGVLPQGKSLTMSGQNDNARPAAPTRAIARAAGATADPRAILPLDRDERGFRGF